MVLIATPSVPRQQCRRRGSIGEVVRQLRVDHQGDSSRATWRRIADQPIPRPFHYRAAPDAWAHRKPIPLQPGPAQHPLI